MSFNKYVIGNISFEIFLRLCRYFETPSSNLYSVMLQLVLSYYFITYFNFRTTWSLQMEHKHWRTNIIGEI